MHRIRNGRFSYLFLHVANLARMTDFYANTLGLSVTFQRADEVCFLALGSGGPQLALFPGEARQPERENHWFFAIDVEALDEVVAELRAVGVTVTDTFVVAGGRAAKITDPEGNVLEIHEPSAAQGSA